MRRSSVGKRLPRGFTLIELITVVAILGILVTLTVSAVQGIRTNVSRKATQELFAALDAALQRYYDDWGKYPYPAATTSEFYGQVATDYSPLLTATTPASRNAVLYAALSMTQRKGPYFRGGSSQTKAVKVVVNNVSRVYYVFTDGWGNEINYLPDTTPSPALNSPDSVPPIMESLGADNDPTSLSDNMRNR